MQAKPVLLVEDNENDAFLLERAWHRCQVANPIQRVRSLAEAKDYLEGKGTFAERKAFPLPCVAIMDLRLRGQDSLSLLAWIRSHPAFKTLIVLMLSGSSYKGDVDRAYHAGANSFLMKPPTQEELTHLVELISNYWLKANHNPPEGEGEV